MQRLTGRLTAPSGSSVNVACDFYKAGAKLAGAGLVKTGPFQYAIRLDYFGELSEEVTLKGQQL